MRFTKSILRPVRATRKGGATPFSFISRRLRTSGSVKGGKASTFFTITGKKKGSGFENHEPSSPKVTCIGQVRVKSKKRVKQCRRRIGEVSFRMAEQSHGGGGVQQIEDRDKFWIRSQRFSNSCAHSHREQRWVHLPNSVCEALRAFRAEICCLFPCKCSCFSTGEREKSTQSGYYENENGCGAVFARWLVAENGGEEGKRREIEVVVGGGGDEERAEMMSIRSSRRHVFDDIEVNDDRIEVKGRSLVGDEEDEEEARVSICIPPKNALLLMRCRSDSMKMASLTNRFSLDASKSENGDVEEAVDFEEQERVRGLFEDGVEILVRKVDHVLEQDVAVSRVQVEAEDNLDMEVGDNDCEEEQRDEEEKEQETEETDQELVEEADESNVSTLDEAVLDQENTESLSESEESGERIEEGKEEETEELTGGQTQVKAQIKSERERAVEQDEEKRSVQSTELVAEKPKSQEMAIINQDILKDNKSSRLPDCLLLMMCEPKLSMEVSKETWVRGTDFIRLLPERPRKPAKTTANGCGGDHEPAKRRPSIDSKSRPRVPAPPSKKNDQQPARSSCSLPAASMATVIERNQASARKCEPFALTRCKSEPMSTAAAKLMPESCFWKNDAGMKLEPHRQATLGVGAAGVGF